MLNNSHYHKPLLRYHPSSAAFASYEPIPPAIPTDAFPGSEEKVDILAARVDRGEDLWHPDDRVCFSSFGELSRGEMIDRQHRHWRSYFKASDE